MMDETRIQYALFLKLTKMGHIAVIPNVAWSWLNWEADVISITKAYFMHEFEIKINKFDFEKDFAKRKHGVLKKDIKNNRKKPNYFTYVFPEKIAPLCIPDYAGLIVVEQNNKYASSLNLVTVREAKRLHNDKISDVGIIKMLRTLMFKYWNLSKNLDQIKVQKNMWSV